MLPIGAVPPLSALLTIVKLKSFGIIIMIVGSSLSHELFMKTKFIVVSYTSVISVYYYVTSVIIM